MKKLMAILCACALTIPTAVVFADDVPLQEVSEKAETKNSLTVRLRVNQTEHPIPGSAVFGIFTADGEFLKAEKISVQNPGETAEITYSLPDYTLGETFYLSCFSGAESVQFYGVEYKENQMIPLTTFTPTDPADENPGNEFFLFVSPKQHLPVTVTVGGSPVVMEHPAVILDNSCLVPVQEFLTAIRVHPSLVTYYPDIRRIDVNGYEKRLSTYLDSTYAYFDGAQTENSVPSKALSGTLYVPFRLVADCMGIAYEVQQNDAGITINLPNLKFEETYLEKTINQTGLSSRTPYLLWVSKKDYSVHVFLGSKNHWGLIKTLPCAIGAPATPTVTGEFEYFSKESRWTYPNYYVGPIMRFYHGYAFHSTLRRYDGTPYDDRVGKKLSHGCVRLHPADIEWMVNYVPLYTKVYITE